MKIRREFHFHDIFSVTGKFSGLTECFNHKLLDLQKLSENTVKETLSLLRFVRYQNNQNLNNRPSNIGASLMLPFPKFSNDDIIVGKKVISDADTFSNRNTSVYTGIIKNTIEICKKNFPTIVADSLFDLISSLATPLEHHATCDICKYQFLDDIGIERKMGRHSARIIDLVTKRLAHNYQVDYDYHSSCFWFLCNATTSKLKRADVNLVAINRIFCNKESFLPIFKEKLLFSFDGFSICQATNIASYKTDERLKGYIVFYKRSKEVSGIWGTGISHHASDALFMYNLGTNKVECPFSHVLFCKKDRPTQTDGIFILADIIDCGGMRFSSFNRNEVCEDTNQDLSLQDSREILYETCRSIEDSTVRKVCPRDKVVLEIDPDAKQAIRNLMRTKR